MARKRRTRGHVIADLGVNHVERVALRAGYTVDRLMHDYGIDLLMTTYDEHGFVEPGQILVQVKATDHPEVLRAASVVAVRVERSHFEAWAGEVLPVILVVYDADSEVAYWLHVQQHGRGLSGLGSAVHGESLTLRVPLANRLDEDAMRRFARLRDEVRARAREEARRRE